jgi:hypothetical protein
VAGREAAALRLGVDGRYSQHVFLTRGDEVAPYRVALGSLARGSHRLRVELDPGASAAGIGAVEVKSIATEAVSAGGRGHRLLAHAPVLHSRPDTMGRFSDVPLLMWVESEPTARGTRLRYSVVFSNEDGGTPADRLMATWGRLTDIEYVYGVELDAAGHVLAEEYQGRDHRIRPFAGTREARHPVLYVVTDNNMVGDHGTSRMRHAPAPVSFDLTGVSREAVMDAYPWTYRVSSEEARREGRVDGEARPGSGKVPDPRRFAYLEACAETRDTVLAFGVGLLGRDGSVEWRDSDADLPSFRIARSPDNFPNGCFRGAVALPPGTTAGDVKALRLRACTRPPRNGETPLPSGTGSARWRQVNRLFLLGPDDLPAPSFFSWRGDVALAPDGPAHELKVGPDS